jgi:hypothetical protein
MTSTGHAGARLPAWAEAGEGASLNRVDVFDPPMCCSTGVCGPGVDPALARFSADLDWLRRQGIAVERFNLAQQPGAFTANPAVKEALARSGTQCLPLILVDGKIVSAGAYPEREILAQAVAARKQPSTEVGAARTLRVVESPGCSPRAPGSRKCC